MIDRIGQGGQLAREAIEAALRRQAETARRIDGQVEKSFAPSEASPASKPDFARTLLDGVREANQSAERVDELPMDMVTGRIGDFHELAVQIKQSELTFKFALEVRNKLIEAYRETMRMNV